MRHDGTLLLPYLVAGDTRGAELGRMINATVQGNIVVDRGDRKAECRRWKHDAGYPAVFSMVITEGFCNLELAGRDKDQ